MGSPITPRPMNPSVIAMLVTTAFEKCTSKVLDAYRIAEEPASRPSSPSALGSSTSASR